MKQTKDQIKTKIIRNFISQHLLEDYSSKRIDLKSLVEEASSYNFGEYKLPQFIPFRNAQSNDPDYFFKHKKCYVNSNKICNFIGAVFDEYTLETNKFNRFHEIIYYKGNKIHRDGDKPAIIKKQNGYITEIRYYKNDQLHRDGDRPAVIYKGLPIFDKHRKRKKITEVYYYKHGVIHRDGDRPAMFTRKPRNIHNLSAYEIKNEKRFYKNGYIHRYGDKPACILNDGKIHVFYKDGEKHRDGDKPAIITSSGRKEFWKNHELHRDGKPAIIKSNGSMEWYKNGYYLKDKIKR